MHLIQVYSRQTGTTETARWHKQERKLRRWARAETHKCETGTIEGGKVTQGRGARHDREEQSSERQRSEKRKMGGKHTQSLRINDMHWQGRATGAGVSKRGKGHGGRGPRTGAEQREGAIQREKRAVMTMWWLSNVSCVRFSVGCGLWALVWAGSWAHRSKWSQEVRVSDQFSFPLGFFLSTCYVCFYQ